MMYICMTNNIRLLILVQHIAPIIKVYIVDNDRCKPQGVRLSYK